MTAIVKAFQAEDADAEFRLNAARALGRIAVADENATKILQDAPKNTEEPFVAVASAESLVGIQTDATAFNTLVQMADHNETAVAFAALRAIERLLPSRKQRQLPGR